MYFEGETLICADKVSKSFNGKFVLKDLSFEIKNTIITGSHQGQIIAVLGRSGRGKSTLLRLMAGLDFPSSGSIKIPDLSKEKLQNGSYTMKVVSEGDVGFVDQKYTLFRHKTVYQALMFALRKLNISSNDKIELVNNYLRDWGLENCKNQYPNELSGGQRQRTAIIEQLLSSSYFIILDEPFSGLDVGNIKNVKSAFKLIDNKEDLNTIIFSTHDVSLAVLLADTIYILGKSNTEEATTLKKIIDLKSIGLAWKSDMTALHHTLVNEITDLLLEL